MDCFDEHLAFDLPEDYMVERNEDEDGHETFKIQGLEEIGNDGASSWKYSFSVENGDYNNSPFQASAAPIAFEVPGQLECRGLSLTKEYSVVFMTFTGFAIVLYLRHDDHLYVLKSTHVFSSEIDHEAMAEWVDSLNQVLDSIRIDGLSGDFELITPELLTSNIRNVDDMSSDDNAFPIATPANDQHSHLSFHSGTKNLLSALSGNVRINQTGTEYAFNRIGDVAPLDILADEKEKQSSIQKLLRRIEAAGESDFDLSETALSMSQLFRVTYEAFNPSDDREQEITSGLIRRAEMYDGLRSFAWTLMAYCEKEEISPVDVDFDTLQRLTAFIQSRNYLNYKADSFCPTLCSGDDCHIYFIPDAVSKNDKKQFSEFTGADAARMKSLDALRKDLRDIFPAIQTIYSNLADDRDPDEPLVNDVADILYAWCSMTYAARESFYSDDGPMNCMFAHPDEKNHWQERVKRGRLKEEIAAGNEWMNRYQKHLTKNPSIQISGKSFVFTGVSHLDEWSTIQEKLKEQGGIRRTTISGKTDYLVCYPSQAGDSKLNQAFAQQQKGSGIQIILLDDLLKALGLSTQTPEEQLEKLLPSSSNTPAKQADVDWSSLNIKQPTYSQGLKADGDGYWMEIPDGFVIMPGAENRDFVAYRSESELTNYADAKFIIFAGQKRAENSINQFRLPVEFSIRSDIVARNISATSVGHEIKIVPYERKDLPGALYVMHDRGCTHINASLYVDGHTQGIRFQISGIKKKERAAYEQIVRTILDHMYASKPVQMLNDLDDKCFIESKVGTDGFTEWVNTIGEYNTHIQLARSFGQSTLINEFEQSQSNGTDDYEAFKSNLQSMLQKVSKQAEIALVQAEVVYALRRSETADEGQLQSAKDAILTLIDLTRQELTLNGEFVNTELLLAESEYAERVKARLEKPADVAIAEMMNDVLYSGKQDTLKLLEEANAHCVKPAPKTAKSSSSQSRNTPSNKPSGNKRKPSPPAPQTPDQITRAQAEKERLQLQKEAAECKANYEKAQKHYEDVKNQRIDTPAWNALNEKLAAAQEKHKLVAEELRQLGFFAFKEKQAKKAQLKQLDNEIAQLNSELKKAADEALAAAEEEVKHAKAALNPDRIVYKKKILAVLKEIGIPATIIDIRHASPWDLGLLSFQTCTSCMAELLFEGRVDFSIQKGQKYYTLR